MDGIGKGAIVFLSAGTLFWALGCSHAPSGEFQSYDELKKSAVGHPVSEERSAARALDSPQSPLSPAPASVVAANHRSPTVPADRPQPVVPTSASATFSDRSAKGVAPVASLPVASASNAGPTGSQRANSAKASPLAVSDATKPANGSAIAVGAALASRQSEGAANRKAEADSQAPRKIQLLVPSRTFKAEGEDGALRVSYDDLDLLKVLNMDPVVASAPALMPAWLKNLDGRRIRIRGFMYPTYQQTGIRAFALARDNQICCFGRNPKVYDVFGVVLRDGVTTNYIPNRPFDVVGVFHIRPEADEGKLYQLYEMEDAVVVTK